MLILGRIRCLPATISQLLHPQQIQKTQNLFVKLLLVQGDHWLIPVVSLLCLWDFLNCMQVRNTKITFLMAQLRGTQTKITLSSVTGDDRGTLSQWSLISMLPPVVVQGRALLCKAFFPPSPYRTFP